MKRKIILLLLSCFCFIQLQAQISGGNNKNTDSLINVYIQYINADSIQSYIQTLEDFGTRFCLADNRRDIAQWIMDKFISFGYMQVRLDSFQMTVDWPYGSGNNYTTWQYNVECTYTGQTFPNEIIILGGHHDAIVYPDGDPFTFAPGADDNASGVAAALEVARVFMEYGFVPSKTIRFVTFAAEELGLWGAFNYAGRAVTNGDDIKLMINNDMISYCTLPQAQRKIQIQKYPNSQFATNLANQIITNHTYLTAVETDDAIQYSDSWAFFYNSFPAIFFIEDQFTPFYHTEDDLVSTINSNYAAEVTKISMGMLLSLTNPISGNNIDNDYISVQHIFNYPNPFSEQTSIHFNAQFQQHVDIQIFDASGRIIETLFSGVIEQGNNTIDWNASHVAAGIYFCKIGNQNYQKVIKLVKKPM